MADFAVSFLVRRLVDALDQIKIYKGVHKEVERLESELKRMQCFLKDADEKQEDDERVRNWIFDIRNVAYDCDDLVDTFIMRVEFHKRKRFFKRQLSCVKEWIYHRKVKQELEALKVRIHDISLSRETYGIRNSGEGTSRLSERLRSLRRSSPRGEERDVVGLDEDTAKLVAQIVNREGQWRAISITGMGGIGKTTLAKRVYNHADLRGRFKCRAWVYVSQDFCTRDVLVGILKQVAPPTRDLETMREERLEEMLYGCLLSKCYLVVLDDMWSPEAWICLMRAFPKRSNGSRLMITTRNKNVAVCVDAQTVPHELQFLNKKDSWELFCRKAFINNIGRSCPPELEETGQAIVGKCAGLPLAIIVLGGLVSRKNNLHEWERVLANVRSHFARNVNGVAAILALSYKDLPQYLKSCFLHLGLFPEDHLISTSKLFKLWVAEGFIQQEDGERMEDVAEDYLIELVDRNMVQVATMSQNERVKECRIHDLLRDLSISKAKEQYFLEIHGNINTQPTDRFRRRAIYSNFDWYDSLNHSTQHLRSLLFFRVDNENCQIVKLVFVCGNFKLLRVLDLENMKISTVPSMIGELIQLKYLGLRHTKLRNLPTAIGLLSSLQTLDLANNGVVIVPNVVWKMKNLRHIYMHVNPLHGRIRVDTLPHLQTLRDIDIDNWVQNNPAKLTSLRKLGIIGDFSSYVREISYSFSKLRPLQSLLLNTGNGCAFPSLSILSHLCSVVKLYMRGEIRNLPPSREFPQNLSKLTLHYSHLNQNPMEILEKLPKLLTLRLKPYSFTGNQLVISTNGFPQLKFLELEFLEFLEELKLEEGAMPRLQSLRISSCRELKFLPEEIRLVTTLKELEIKDMRKTFISRLQGEDFHKVQHIPKIIWH